MSDAAPTDKNFPVRIKSPLAGDLLVASVTGEEEMGRLFVFHIDLLSKNFELHFNDVLGQEITVILSLPDEERFFHGFVTEFRYAGASSRFARYQATIRPWFWFLTRTADCRIFQEKTVPDIIKEVFRDNGMADFEDRLSGNYRTWEYCVQYRESDFNFISRLMEQEGIYYFFEHHADKHMLVLADDISAHNPYPKHPVVAFHPENDDSHGSRDDRLDVWTTMQSIMPSTYAVQDFNFKTPKVNLLSKLSRPDTHASPLGNSEIFDYPGEYLETGDGMNYVEIRLQELRCQQQRVQAGGSCRWISPGRLFTFEDYPREDQNTEYLVISVVHTIHNAAFDTIHDSAVELYRCQIEVMDKGKPFRTARSTPKPMVQGPQTAIVVGPEGEEIHTDDYGRVKVQFHWDRYGKKDENSSCWVRVSQVWAGAKWGAMHVPRIDQEVIVSFMEGDPDRPIITGRVYNADCMPPYDLPANKTQSGIKSRSTKDANHDNFNEIRMEDKIGEEELYIHAEKNQNNVVENDETTEVGHDRTENVGNNESISIGVNRTESVGKNESISIAENRTEDVGKNETISIGENRTEDVGKNETISIGKDQAISIGENQTETVGKNLQLSIGEKRSTEVAKDDSLNVGKKLTMVAGDQITLKTGSASIVMKKDGTIVIKGKDIKLQGSGKIDVKASKAITMKGSKIMQN